LSWWAWKGDSRDTGTVKKKEWLGLAKSEKTSFT